MITEFRGSTRWLSNFEECEVWHEGLRYGSSEAAYQAAKLDKNRRDPFTRMSPREAKKAGRLAVLPLDWDRRRLRVMAEVLVDKFTRNGHLREKLLATGDVLLVEGNTWGDTYWGVCEGRGENYLGRLLMVIRDQLRGASP